MNTKTIVISVLALFLTVAGAKAISMTSDELRSLLGGQPQELGSVQRGGEYHGKTLTPSSDAGAVITDSQGTFGSVIMTGGTGGALTLYNATTTNANLRANATSTLEKIASFTADQTVGTYTFDVQFNTGLVYEWDGTVASSTITWR